MWFSFMTGAIRIERGAGIQCICGMEKGRSLLKQGDGERTVGVWLCASPRPRLDLVVVVSASQRSDELAVEKRVENVRVAPLRVQVAHLICGCNAIEGA